MNVFEKTWKMIKVYRHNNGANPNIVLVGHQELDEMRASYESLGKMEIEENKMKVFGIELQEVSQKSYLKVGYLSDEEF